MVEIEVKANLRGITDKLGPQGMLRGRQALADQMLADMNKYVPYQSHALRKSASVAMDGSAIYYNTPYAAAQFFGSNGKAKWVKGKEPGTGPRWDKKAERSNIKVWEKAFLRGAGIK